MAGPRLLAGAKKRPKESYVEQAWQADEVLRWFDDVEADYWCEEIDKSSRKP